MKNADILTIYYICYVDLVVREIKEDTRAETFLGKASKNYKPCHRVVCDVRPSDVYVLKIKQVYYIVVPSYCKEGLYEKLATQAELVTPLVINGVLQKLPDSL